MRSGVHPYSKIGVEGPWILLDGPGPRLVFPPFDGWGPDRECRPIDFAAVPAPYCPLGCVGGCVKAKRTRHGDWTHVTPSPECALIPGSEAERMARAGTLPPGGVWVGLGTRADVVAHAKRIAPNGGRP